MLGWISWMTSVVSPSADSAVFRDLGVEFVLVHDGLNFSGPLGLALYALVAALAEAKVQALRERSVAGLRNARANSQFHGELQHSFHPRPRATGDRIRGRCAP